MSVWSRAFGFFVLPPPGEAVERAAAHIAPPTEPERSCVVASFDPTPRPVASYWRNVEPERVLLDRLAVESARPGGSPLSAARTVFGGERQPSTASVSGPASPLNAP